MQSQIISFLLSNETSAFIVTDTLTAYLRKDTKMIKRVRTEVIVLSSVFVQDKFQGKGIFKDFLNELMLILHQSDTKVMYAEYICTKQLERFFVCNGWTKVRGFLNSYYLKIS